MIKKIKLSACLIAAFALSSCGGDSPSDISVSVTERLYEGDVENLVDSFHVGEKEKGFMDSLLKTKMLEQAQKNVKQHGSVKSIKAVKESMSSDGNECTVQIAITFEDGTVKTETHYLVKVDGEWLESMNTK